MEDERRIRILLFCGWVCPVCGKVLNPSIMECPCGGVDPEELEEDESEEEESKITLPYELPADMLWIDREGFLHGCGGYNSGAPR